MFVVRILATSMLAILLLTVTIASGDEMGSVPESLDRCVAKATRELLSVGTVAGQTEAQRKATLWQLFLSYADPYWLGARSYGGNNWKNFSPEEKEAGYKLFFNYIYSKGLENLSGGRDLTKTAFAIQMSNRPEGIARRPNIFHVVVTLMFNDGTTDTADLIITSRCKLIDIYQTAWISIALSAEMVDKATREHEGR